MSNPNLDPLKPGTVFPQAPITGKSKAISQGTTGASQDSGVDEFVPSESLQRLAARESVINNLGLSDEAASLLRGAVNKKYPLA